MTCAVAELNLCRPCNQTIKNNHLKYFVYKTPIYKYSSYKIPPVTSYTMIDFYIVLCRKEKNFAFLQVTEFIRYS